MAIQSALKMAEINMGQGTSHVGYFLIGKGVAKIEKEAKMRSTFKERCQKFVNKIPLVAYTGGIIISDSIS